MKWGRTLASVLAVVFAGTVAAGLAAPGCGDDDAGPGSFENTADLCTNGVDDDLNGWTDCLDFNCVTLVVCDEPDAGDEAEADADVEEDAAEDLPDLPDFSLEMDDAACDNDIDDDLDSLTDCEDPGCQFLEVCLGDAGTDADADGDAGVCYDPCEGGFHTQCLPGDVIRGCEDGCWEYYSCWDICEDSGWVYDGECRFECYGASGDACCCSDV